jgi:hypothetical protein
MTLIEYVINSVGLQLLLEAKLEDEIMDTFSAIYNPKEGSQAPKITKFVIDPYELKVIDDSVNGLSFTLDFAGEGTATASYMTPNGEQYVDELYLPVSASVTVEFPMETLGMDFEEIIEALKITVKLLDEPTVDEEPICLDEIPMPDDDDLSEEAA